MQINSGSLVAVEWTQFQSNFAYNYAVFRIIGSSSFSFYEAQFLGNIAESNGSVG